MVGLPGVWGQGGRGAQHQPGEHIWRGGNWTPHTCFNPQNKVGPMQSEDGCMQYLPFHSVNDLHGEVLVPPAVQEEAEFIHLQQVTEGRLLLDP